MTDREKLCKEFHKLTGGHWHEVSLHRDGINHQCSCGAVIYDPRHYNEHLSNKNPSYENHADVLRKIIEIGLYDEFMVQYGGLSKFGRHLDSILVDLILEPDALLKVAVNFLRAKAAKD